MKRHISIAAIFTVLMLVIVIFLCIRIGNKRAPKDKSDAVFVSNEAIEYDSMRGLWVSFITLDMSGTDRSFDSFKKKFDAIITDAKNLGTNTLIVQVRPFSDALYESEIYPHSHIISGEQGKSPSYDARGYMCEATHEAGLRIHAWINPYRVATPSSPAVLSENSPYYIDDGVGFETESGKFLNPASEKAREIIIDGVKEIVENYDVDGIQFDDYFYPADCGDFDAENYSAYIKATPDAASALPLKLWRQNNVNLLLSRTYMEIKRINPSVVFGVSPQGNIQNDYDMGADVKAWCESFGYLDYICPQMYYSIDNPLKGFEESLIEWKEFSYHKDLEIYIGLGAYKIETDADNGTWISNQDELREQLKLLREYGYDGYMIYDYSALESEEKAKCLDVFREAVYQEMTSPSQ